MGIIKIDLKLGTSRKYILITIEMC